MVVRPVRLVRVGLVLDLFELRARLLRTAMAQFTEGLETRGFFKARALLEQIQDQSDADTTLRPFNHPKQLVGPGRNVPVTRMDFIKPLMTN